MKPVVFVLIAMTAALAQAPQRRDVTLSPAPPPFTAGVVERNLPVTHSDLYCAGFVSPKLLPKNSFVAGGLNTPFSTRFGTNDVIFLHGSGLVPGTRVGIVRQVRDVNRYNPFPGERQNLQKAGAVFSDLGYAVVLETRGADTAVAQVEFSCEDLLPGDLLVPFVTRSPVSYRLRSAMDRFPAATPSLAGHIVASREFDQYLSAGRKIYLDIGADKGVKPGDYFRIVRGYDPKQGDETDAQIRHQTVTDDYSVNGPRMPKAGSSVLPRRVVGEAIILSTQPSTATAMITFSLEEAYIGDSVEMEESGSK